MKVYLSKKANIRLIEYLESKGHELILVDGSFVVDNGVVKSRVGEAIICHPDIYYCNLGSEIYQGDVSLLDKEYPKDVLYNAARVGSYFFCSKYTHRGLVDKAEAMGLKLIFVPQGYVKCNLVVIDEGHVITEDEGIYNALQCSGADIECLLVTKGHVALPGYKYGFIGGASGRIGDELIINGDLSVHPDFIEISAFVSNAGLSLKYFEEYPLEDIGSIIST